MKALMVLALLLGVMAMLARTPAEYAEREPRAQIIALNYAVYRNQAFLYAHKHKGFNGSVPLSALGLPSEWRALRPWTARMESGRCYVYGAASAEEIEAVRELFRGSFAVGRAEGGRLVPDGRASLPGFIPTDSLVSIVEVE